MYINSFRIQSQKLVKITTNNFIKNIEFTPDRSSLWQKYYCYRVGSERRLDSIGVENWENYIFRKKILAKFSMAYATQIFKIILSKWMLCFSIHSFKWTPQICITLSKSSCWIASISSRMITFSSSMVFRGYLNTSDLKWPQEEIAGHIRRERAGPFKLTIGNEIKRPTNLPHILHCLSCSVSCRTVLLRPNWLDLKILTII